MSHALIDKLEMKNFIIKSFHVPRLMGRFSSLVTDTLSASTPLPTSSQLWRHYISSATPMIAFGFMDQTIMIHAGNAIDCTLGVYLGLSTLSAAAVGGLISNVSGILFGGTVETIIKVPSSLLTAEQRQLPFVRRNRILAQAFGVIIGCTFGLLNLLLIDTERSSALKLEQLIDEHDDNFHVDVDNSTFDNKTLFTVRCPDHYGLLASLTQALTLNDCSIVNISIEKKEDGMVLISFHVVSQSSGNRLEDGNLSKIAKVLYDSSKEGPHFLKAQVNELLEQNTQLKEKLNKIEHRLIDRRMTLRPSHS